MSIVYSIVVLQMTCKLDLDVSWHDRGQAVVIDTLPLICSKCNVHLCEAHFQVYHMKDYNSSDDEDE